MDVYDIPVMIKFLFSIYCMFLLIRWAYRQSKG